MNVTQAGNSRGETAVVAVDFANATAAARECGLQGLPVPYLVRDQRRAGRTVVRVLATLILPALGSATQEKIREWETAAWRKKEDLERLGVSVILCRGKRTESGADKKSDDSWLMTATLAECMRVRPSWLVLVSGDGDFEALVCTVREFGVRTEVVSARNGLARELRRAATKVTLMESLFASDKAQTAAYVEAHVAQTLN